MNNSVEASFGDGFRMEHFKGFSFYAWQSTLLKEITVLMMRVDNLVTKLSQGF